jgi:eukaryotic-like serine/threonine-protein kinase
VALHRTVQNNVDVWLVDLMRGGSTRFTFDAATDGFPLWSPDGTRIAFASNRNGVMDLYLKPSSGAGSEELVRESPSNKLPLSWSSDGRFLLVVEAGPTKTADLWTQPLTGDGKPSPWLNTPFAETGGQFSPDGRWVAYQSNEFRFVRDLRTAVSGRECEVADLDRRWNHAPMAGGREGALLHRSGREADGAAGVTASDRTFEAAPPIALFETRIQGGPNQIFKHQYAVSRDGRFLITELAEESVPTPITLILNWQPRP